MPSWIVLFPLFGRATDRGNTYRYDRRDLVMMRQV
jgi:hypothetical protein